MLNQSLSINDVEAQFIKWRSNKSRGNAKIPVELWANVKTLLKSKQHSTGFIAKRLRLTTHQLRENNLLPIIASDKPDKSATNSFLSLSIPTNTKKSTEQPQGTELTIMHGDTKCIIHNPNIEQLQLIISKILG